MIRDAADLEEGAELSADICVIGAGAAGITLALSLRESGLSVIVLESGGRRDEEAAQALYRGTMSGISTWDLDEKRRRILGGSTSRWGGWCRPLSPEDFEQRDYIPQSGWPLSYEDLAPSYERAQELVEVGAFNYNASEISEHSGRPLIPSTGKLQTDVFRFSPPTRFGARYADDLEDATNVDVYLHANVVDIVLDEALDSVDHLSCVSMPDTHFTVSAGRFVLATGGVENARLLLASNRQREAGIANGNDVVGRYFMEHPHYNNSVTWVTSPDVDVSFYQRHEVTLPTDDASETLEVRGMFALSDEIRRTEGLPAFGASLEGGDIDRHTTGELAALDVSALIPPDPDTRIWRLTPRAEQTPDPESRVTLTDELDALGMPRVDLHWSVRPEDNVTMRRGLEILGAEIAAAGLGRIFTRTADGVFRATAHPGGHHMGTTRMSDSPETGVVDGDGRCFEVDNLYIAGSSVFPTGGHANPTLTIVALAARLADHLMGETS